MATVKVKARKSTIESKMSTLFIQFIHERQVKIVTTKLRLYPHEWNERKQTVVINDEEMERIIYLSNIQKEINRIKDRLDKIIKRHD